MQGHSSGTLHFSVPSAESAYRGHATPEGFGSLVPPGLVLRLF